MPNKLDGIDIISEEGWVKFDRSWVVRSTRKIKYKFKCSLKPIFLLSKGNLYPVKLNDEYLITNFQIISSIEGTLEMLYLGNDQRHPHKDPRNSCLCLGKFEGKPISKGLIALLICCILRYNQDDCFSVPDSCCVLEK